MGGDGRRREGDDDGRGESLFGLSLDIPWLIPLCSSLLLSSPLLFLLSSPLLSSPLLAFQDFEVLGTWLGVTSSTSPVEHADWVRVFASAVTAKIFDLEKIPALKPAMAVSLWRRAAAL